MTARLEEIWGEFRKNKNKFKLADLGRRMKFLNRGFVLRGQHKEALLNATKDREYQKLYREENREKLRSYHTNYARIRRSKKRFGFKESPNERI